MYKEIKVNFILSPEQSQKLTEVCGSYNKLHGTTLPEDDFFRMIMTVGNSHMIDERLAQLEKMT